MTRTPTLVWLLLVASALGVASRATAQSAPPAAPSDPLAGPIRSILDAGRHPSMNWPNLADVKAASDRLYAETGGGALWYDGAHPGAPAGALIEAIVACDTLGLRPEDFDAKRLTASLRSYGAGATEEKAPSISARARFDAALTANALRFVTALARGRIDPAVAGADLFIPRGDFDAAAVVDTLRRAPDAASVDALLDRIQPPHRHYRLLLAALARYRRIGRDTTLVPLPGLPKKLEPGQAYTGSARLRRLLVALRDLPAGSSGAVALPAGTDTLYDSTLAAGVRSFQERQGMKPDGVIGGRTAKSLNRPFADRVHSIELTLERWRWLPHTFAAPPILVNIPAFRLYAFARPDDDETGMLAMSVVVGRAYDTRTPVFSEMLDYVVFSPYWEVPPSIYVKEIRPKARANPSYLASHHYELLRGETVVSATASNINAIGKGVRVRQTPGEHNSLGRVKFMLPNPFNVYLHDTPSKSKFEEERRDYSHGCVRVADPPALAGWALSDDSTWTQERILSAMGGPKPDQVNLRVPRPVFILYGTSVATQDGRVFFYSDLYKLDAKLDPLLKRGYPLKK
ncbi:MAG: L,D-transpeptidase family protein [Candidatus Eiseniibacteriota bacterium]